MPSTICVVIAFAAPSMAIGPVPPLTEVRVMVMVSLPSMAASAITGSWKLALLAPAGIVTASMGWKSTVLVALPV